MYEECSLSTYTLCLGIAGSLRSLNELLTPKRRAGSGHGHVDLGSVITLSGSAIRTQATTCAEYMRQTWPASGVENLNLICEAFEAPDQTAQSKSQQHISLSDIAMALMNLTNF